MNYPLLSKMLGWVFVVLTMAFSVCLGMAWFLAGAEPEIEAVMVFGGLVISNFIIAVVLFWRGRNAVPQIFRKEALCIVGLGWIVASLIGSVPYYFLLEDCDWATALFESTSGLTTTGASAFSAWDHWPQSLLFWRQLSQWIGGLGVVVLFVAILSLVGAGARILFFQENSGDQQDLGFGRISSGVNRLIGLYLFLSVICLFAYYFAGMDWFDAISHMFTTVSTAGFSTHPASIGGFDSLAIELVAIVFMIVCGMTFFILLKARRNPLELFRSTEIRVYLWLLFLLSLTGAVTLFLTGQQTNFWESLRVSTFQFVSILTTTGYSTADYALWPTVLVSLLVICMLIGGCSGSTAGGFKVIRVILLFKLAQTAIEKSFRARVFRPVQVKGKVISNTGIENVMTYLVLVLMITLPAIVLIALFDADKSLETQVSAVIACFFNIGPGLGDVGPAGNFSSISYPGKIMLSILMVMGRLELFAILVLFSPSLWRKFS